MEMVTGLVAKPWGSYEVLDDKPNYKVKRIIVEPGHRLSYQKHTKRSEHWFIVEGQAMVTLDGKDYHLSAGQSIDISIGAAHRIQNPSKDQKMIFIEVQLGTYFGEDDIERLSDDYGRG
ncbi:MAG: phosphomannose isomerase type II C-terminal cupin domain [Candidatus Caenarcaniphilales bacterium]|nr:phosphomannose isomerase type II C-terminal cupin domain [Candidatus Caenarcaniphilales bacterium]